VRSPSGGKGFGSILDPDNGPDARQNRQRPRLADGDAGVEPVLRYYQKNGFHLHALRVNALAESRKLKPEIPAFGNDGIPLRDEIELSMTLD